MTRTRTPIQLTPLESLIMDAVWRQGTATVRQVQDDLQASRPMAYNTVLTVMRILREKGYLESDRQGRADLYRPCVTRQQTGRRRLGDLLHRFFSGSPAALVSQLLESEAIDAEELKAIRREVDQKLREQARNQGDAP